MSVAFSPDGKTIAAGYRVTAGDVAHHSGGVVLWDVAAHKRLVDEPLPVKEGIVWSVAFSPDGKTIAAGYEVTSSFGPGRGGVVLWDVAARKRLVDEPLSVKEGEVRSVAFSPDGKTIVAGCGFRGVMLWDVAARKRLVDEPLSVTVGTVEVGSVAFSPDGKTIAAGCSGGVGGGVGGVVLWDVAARKRLVDEPLSVREGNVESVAFSPDGKTIAAGYFVAAGGGGVVLFDVDFESWQHRAGQIANRNFTREEWRDYFPERPYHATFPHLPVPPEVTPK